MANEGSEMLEKAMVGFSHYEKGNFEEARKIFEQLTEKDPSEGYYWTALGAVLVAEDSLESAEAALNRAIAISGPDVLAAYLNRGEVYLRQGHPEKAINDFNLAAGLDPKNETPLSARARALAQDAQQALEARK